MRKKYNGKSWYMEISYVFIDLFNLLKYSCIDIRRGWMLCNFFDYSSPFCFLLIEFHCIFFHILYNNTILCLLILYFDETVIGCLDFFLLCPLYFSHTHAPPFTIFICVIVFFHSCCSHG